MRCGNPEKRKIRIKEAGGVPEPWTRESKNSFEGVIDSIIRKKEYFRLIAILSESVDKSIVLYIEQ